MSVKINRKQVIFEDFVSSDVITDNDNISNTASSLSSFFPSDLMRTPIGFICRVDICELNDFPATPLPIVNSHFATLVASAQKKRDENQLLPSDCTARLQLSTIFQTEDSSQFKNDNDNDSDSLPKNIYKNICVFNRALQTSTLYVQLFSSTNLEQIALNNVITSTYLPHGKPRVKSKGSEINLVASSVSTFLSPLFSAHDQVQIEFDTTSWIFKQQDGVERR